jgi:uncharacterized repeat protein (TIGR01451 family)
MNTRQTALWTRWAPRSVAALLVTNLLWVISCSTAWAAAGIPRDIEDAVARGVAQDLIVEYDSRAVEREAQVLRAKRGFHRDEAEVLNLKKLRYRDLKRRLRSTLPAGEHETIADYDHLPLSVIRIHSKRALDKLAAHPLFRAAYRNELKHPVLDGQSASLIGVPPAAALGLTGNGSTVLVIDTGTNYTLTDLGSCTAPGMPASCRVVQALAAVQGRRKVNIVTDPNPVVSSANDHGTNVASIVAGVATGAQVAVINIFGTTSSASDAVVLAAIDWGIANAVAFNIRSMNLSLGDGVLNTSPCAASAYVTAFANALSAGIVPSVSAGNEGYTTGLAAPACAPGATSVGAVYTGNFGGLTWNTVASPTCTDASTSSDQVTCFSNSASFLSLLAPGAFITAGGLSFAGTSQASPFVAAAAAILHIAYPADTPARTVERLKTSSTTISDARNGLVKPRLDLLFAARPANDNFAMATSISGNAGQSTSLSSFASKEPGEPDHAGNAGGKSVWWKWTAPSAGQVTLTSNGSAFSTLIAVYTGSALGSLSIIASTTNGTLVFEANSNTEYQIAVDGVGGTGGNVVLSWGLDATATADLSIATSGPTNGITVGSPFAVTTTVRNNGPQTATHVAITATLPSSATLQALPSSCTSIANTIVCNLGTMASGGSAVLNLSLVPVSASLASLTFGASSDLPDPMPGNNSVTRQFSFLPAAGTPGIDTDVPTLPEWAALLLAMGFLVMMLRKSGADVRNGHPNSRA